MRCTSFPAIALFAGLLVVVAVPAFAQDPELVPGSTVPRVQLTGEHVQIETGGTYFTTPTQSATLSRFGLAGTDLGRPLTVGDRIFLFFGDTVGAYRQGDRYFASRGIPAGSGDSIATLPNEDFSACRYIEDVVAQIQRGVAAPAGDMRGCPSLSVLLNPLRASNEHVFKPMVIDGLAADESMGIFRVPTAVVEHNNAVYVFATTKFQDSRPAGAFWLQSVIAKSTQPPALWSDTNPPAFRRLHTVSSHPEIADPANPPRIEQDAGKFMNLTTVVMDVRQIADLQLTRFLPRELQASDVVFVWGRGWHPQNSDMYLAAFAKGDIEAGPAGWFYYAGNSTWTRSERDAAGLLAATDVSQQGVTWNAALGRFVLMRGATARIVAQFSTTPWGPWSRPITVIDNADPWLARLLHRPGENRIVGGLVPIYNADGTLQVREEERGVPYAPNVLDRYTVNADGSVTLYYTLSTWNPYQVFLFSSTFRPASAVRSFR
jgi:hypothetical protein